MTTANDQINGALRLIGQLAEGETPSAATSADALTAMNQMLDSWSAERLSVFSTQDQIFTWPANTATRSLGPTGNFVGNRPVLVDDATYFVDTSNGISFGIKHINRTPAAMPFAWCHCSMPDCRHSGSLLVRLITKKDRPNLEHCNISFATILIAGGSRQKIWQGRWAHD